MNFIFDFGGVVFQWDPTSLIRTKFDDPSSIELIRSFFLEQDWLDYDQGFTSLDEVSLKCSALTGLPLINIYHLFQCIPSMMEPIQGTLELISKIKSRGHHVFGVSNMPEASMQYFENNYKILDQFDGMVISSRVHLLKPNKEIYKYLILQYNLTPCRSVFIDDSAVNLEVASGLGMKTIQFISPEQCDRELKEYIE